MHVLWEIDAALWRCYNPKGTGGMTELAKEPVSKTGTAQKALGVRVPLPPPPLFFYDDVDQPPRNDDHLEHLLAVQARLNLRQRASL